MTKYKDLNNSYYIPVLRKSTSSSTLNDYINIFYNLPNNINIFKNVSEELNSIRNEKISEFLRQFIFRFQSILLSMDNIKNTSNYLPPLMINLDEDESVLLEWIFKDFRIGFSIETNIDESSWYLVSNKNLEEYSMSGMLKIKDIDDLLIKIIKFVLRNT